MSQIMLYFFTKTFTGLWFSLFNIYLIRKYYKARNLLIKGIVLFLISYSMVSFATELFWRIWLQHFPPSEGMMPYLSQVMIVTECLMVLVPIHIFRRIDGLKMSRAVLIYFEYACIERLSSVMAIGMVSYIAIYILMQILVYMEQKKDLDYIISKHNTIRWDALAVYMIGLKFVLDELYAASDVFMELKENFFNIQSLWLSIMALFAALFIAGFFRLGVMNAKVNDDKIQYMQKFQNAQEKIIQTFAEIMEAKSGETGQHVRRVAEYSEAIASQMDENNDYRDYLRVASMMHDVGKLMIPIAILEKPGPLTDLEFQMMMTHTNYGDSLLSHSDGKIMDIARSIAYEHHERWDGKGYPRGLRGNQISIYAQIVSVADVYDALTSNRAYKEAWDPEEAKKEILRQSGKQFSPSVVDAFIGCYDKIEEIRRANADA